MKPFLLRMLELQMAMALGALVCLLVGRLVRASSTYAIEYQPGTPLFFVGDVFFLTVPVVMWNVFRHQALRHGLELAPAMLAPVAAIVVVGEVTRSAYLLWLVNAMYPAMSFGMLLYLLHDKSVSGRKRDDVSVPVS